MPASARSTPFAFTFHPLGRDADGEPVATQASGSSKAPYPKQKYIPINSFAPILMDNDNFKGHMMLIHDTGNEVGLEVDDAEADPDQVRRGVILEIQGKFKNENSRGPDTASGLYVGGELASPLKLGYFMSKIVGMCGSYANKKTQGRFHFLQGDAKTLPQLAFPIAQLFTVVETPEGQEPPRLGTPELLTNKWQGNSRIDINTTSTWTFFYKTPFLDCCSWELLNIPGVSPLGLERILGEIIASDVVMYDLGVAGSHANFRQGAILSWFFTRRTNPGDTWPEPEGRLSVTGILTPDEASDASEASEAEEIEDDEDALELDEVVEEGAFEEGETDSSDEEGALEADEDDIISRAESQALVDLDQWMPRPSRVLQPESETLSIGMPFYIETIDRRRKRRVRVWYVFQLKDTKEGDCWTAKAVNELAALCQPRPRLRAFRRRRGASRGCPCYSVSTLEQFRHVVRTHLTRDTKLKRAVIAAANAELRPAADLGEQSEAVSTVSPHPSIDDDSKKTEAKDAKPLRTPSKGTNDSDAASPSKENDEKLRTKIKKIADEQLKNLVDKADTIKDKAGAVKTKAATAVKGGVNKVRRTGAPTLPPPFFVSSDSKACDKAFEHAKEGRSFVVHEGLVGAVHFEGRMCEELLRLSKDGILRCFMPYDCEKPRVKLLLSQIRTVKSIPGVFLGRFHLWEVHTLFRVFVFCSPDEQDRYEWVRALTPKEDEPEKTTVQWPLVGETAAHLMDLTRARRFKPAKRIVLNDRILVAPEDNGKPQPHVAEILLDSLLSLKEKPGSSELAQFIDATCKLKAINFNKWTQNELMAFWLNIYHCLLLHGRLVLGTPKSRAELARFHSRVSYLVGVRPVSLREIERHILMVPNPDRLAVATSGRARGLQFFGMCCFCCKRRNAKDGAQLKLAKGASKASTSSSPTAKGPESPKPGKAPDDKLAPPGEPLDLEADGATAKAKSSGSKSGTKSGNLGAMSTNVKGKMTALAKVPQGLVKRAPSSYLFLGDAPAATGIPERDMRAAFCINRANVSCLPNIPLFSAGHVNDQMTEACKMFCAEFVQVKSVDGKPTRAILPHCCRGIKRQLINDMPALLEFVWQFLPKDSAPPTKQTQTRFSGFRREPRRRHDLKRLSFTTPELNVDVKALQGKEFQVLTAAAPPPMAATSPENPTGADDVPVKIEDFDPSGTLPAGRSKIVSI